jgi:PAS domain S-box-containing protein
MAASQSEEAYGQLFHGLPEAAALLQVIVGKAGAPVDFLFLDVNRMFPSLLGVTEGEQVGRRFSELSFAARHFERLASVASSGEPMQYEVYDAEISKHLRVSAFPAGAGRLAMTLRDATAERIADVERARWLEQRSQVVDSPAGWADRVRETEMLFRTTVENIPINLILYDRDLRVLYINPSLAAMASAFGRAASNMIGQHASEVWPDFIWQPLRDHCQRALRTGERQNYELDLRMPSGERAIRQWTIVPIVAANGEIQQLLAMTHDLTAQRRLLNELQEADRRKSDFIAVLSHELRNPLAAMRSTLYVLERSPAGTQTSVRARQAVERQVQHLARMVDDLLDVTRIARNKIALQRTTLDLREVVRQTIEDHRAHIEESGLRIDMELATQPVIVNADPARIAQVVANLVSNATKFTPAGGTATVSVVTSDVEGMAVLQVADSGVGLDPILLPRLFVPFTQADRSLDRAGGGLGLGLALVKGLVELHGGGVEAHSDGPGKGTTMIVRLPLDRAAVATPKPTLTPSVPPRRRVLIIEDDREVREGLRAALEIDDHEVQSARSGAEGLDMARRFRPEVVLCDIGLPGMNGYDVARAFRADPQLSSMFLVALSGYAQASDLARAQEAGFDHHLAKPAPMPKIQEAIAAGSKLRSR